MHRFFVTSSPLRAGSTVALDELAHQLHTVLRLRIGASVLLLDGSGRQYVGTIQRLDSRSAVIEIGEGAPCATEPRLQIALYACSLKGEKYEWVLQKATELGVCRIVPTLSTRSVVRPLAALERKYSRWRSVIREAAEQSNRARLPVLAPPLEFDDAVAGATGMRLLLWEGASAAPLISGLDGEVSLLVGPEGGFTREEAELAAENGWRLASMGPRILRAESASIAAVTALLVLAGDLGTFGAEAATPPPA